MAPCLFFRLLLGVDVKNWLGNPQLMGDDNPLPALSKATNRWLLADFPGILPTLAGWLETVHTLICIQ